MSIQDAQTQTASETSLKYMCSTRLSLHRGGFCILKHCSCFPAPVGVVYSRELLWKTQGWGGRWQSRWGFAVDAYINCFFPPSQFVAHSPDLDQTVIDKSCKLQNLLQHAQHASSVCFTWEHLKKKKKSKRICSVSAGGYKHTGAYFWWVFDPGLHVSATNLVTILFYLQFDQIRSVWPQVFQSADKPSDLRTLVFVEWLQLCGLLLIELFPKECSRCYKTAHGWVF